MRRSCRITEPPGRATSIEATAPNSTYVAEDEKGAISAFRVCLGPSRAEAAAEFPRDHRYLLDMAESLPLRHLPNFSNCRDSQIFVLWQLSKSQFVMHISSTARRSRIQRLRRPRAYSGQRLPFKELDANAFRVRRLAKFFAACKHFDC
jgi:hypothetical protein